MNNLLAGQSCEDRTRVRSMRFRAEALTPDPHQEYSNFSMAAEIEVEPLDGISAEEVANIWQPKVDRLVGQAIKAHLHGLTPPPPPNTRQASNGAIGGGPPSSPPPKAMAPGGSAGGGGGDSKYRDYQVKMVREIEARAAKRGITLDQCLAHCRQNYSYSSGKPVTDLHFLSNVVRPKLEAWIDTYAPSRAEIEDSQPDDIPF